MIFPGMDPYLEDPQIWPGVHGTFLVYLRDELHRLLGRRYIAAVEERVYLDGPEREVIPDGWLAPTDSHFGDGGVAVLDVEGDTAVIIEAPGLEIHEKFLTILDRASGQQVVTVIELVSPANKHPGAGRTSYLGKQAEFRDSEAHLIEIDLLRTGQHVLAPPERLTRRHGPYDYLISINRARGTRSRFELYPRARLMLMR